VSAGSEWNNWLLFSHAQDFGVSDPQFGRDIGFYVFQLPFYTFLVEWLFVSTATMMISLRLAEIGDHGPVALRR
jgi:uncharacterized membrane protein (UPF0182 family)